MTGSLNHLISFYKKVQVHFGQNKTSVYDYHFCYNYNNSEIDSVIIGNEDVEVEMQLYDASQFRDN